MLRVVVVKGICQLLDALLSCLISQASSPGPTAVTPVFYVCLVQVPANERYELEAMPVPVVMVALAGGAGGRVIESKTNREIKACEGGVFFLPAYTPVMVSGTPPVVVD